MHKSNKQFLQLILTMLIAVNIYHVHSQNLDHPRFDGSVTLLLNSNWWVGEPAISPDGRYVFVRSGVGDATERVHNPGDRTVHYLWDLTTLGELNGSLRDGLKIKHPVRYNHLTCRLGMV